MKITAGIAVSIADFIEEESHSVKVVAKMSVFCAPALKSPGGEPNMQKLHLSRHINFLKSLAKIYR